MWMNHAVGPWWPAAWLFTVLFWGLVIWAVVSLFRRAGRGAGPYREGPPADRRGAAEDILAERFARGEIDEREYRHRLDVLHSGRRPSDQDRQS
jgi:putative membrane protein